MSNEKKGPLVVQVCFWGDCTTQSLQGFLLNNQDFMESIYSFFAQMCLSKNHCQVISFVLCEVTRE